MEVERYFGLGCRECGLKELTANAGRNTESNTKELCVERAVSAEERELSAAELDNEVEDPVKSFTEPPAKSCSFVSNSVLFNFDIAVESVEHVLLDRDDSLDDESKSTDDGERILAHVDKAQWEVLF